MNNDKYLHFILILIGVSHFQSMDYFSEHVYIICVSKNLHAQDYI